MPQALSPSLYVGASLIITLGSLLAHRYLGLQEDYVFAPTLALAAVYALFYFVRQCRGDGDFHIDGGIELTTLLRRALVRYLLWLAVLYTGYQFYLLVPPYNGPLHTPTHRLYGDLLHWYLWLGIPYFALTLTFKASRREDFYDPAVRMLHVLKQIGLRGLRGDSRASVFRVLRRPYNRKVFLNLLMRAYFIPVMVEQIIPGAAGALNSLLLELGNHQLASLLILLAAILWLMDIYNASIAYCLESRWLENRSHSIDLTVGGWLVCLGCYPPLNEVTGSLFAFAPFVATGNPADLLFGGLGFLYTLKIVEILILGLHIYTDVSLGPSVANITLKKLQTRGVYGIIRHPGVSTKLLLWLVQSMFYQRFWSARYLFGYAGWGLLYVLRALTEERHLSKFAAYRAYRQKVKHRFIPWLF